MESSLYQLRELSDVFVDACVRDASGSLLFLSCYGRDTALTQLFAAFSLSPAEGGFRAFSLTGADDRDHYVSVSGAERLKKIAGRLPRENLFGNLAQAWIYDPVVIEPDRSNRLGWVLIDRDRYTGDAAGAAREVDARVWSMIELLSPVPLLAHWEGAVREAVADAVTDLSTTGFQPLGRVHALRVQLPEEFAERVSQLVKCGQFCVEAVREVCHV